MVKTKIIEVTKKYDTCGNLKEKTKRKERTKDDTEYTATRIDQEALEGLPFETPGN